jgi:hypothetical protein
MRENDPTEFPPATRGNQNLGLISPVRPRSLLWLSIGRTGFLVEPLADKFIGCARSSAAMAILDPPGGRPPHRIHSQPGESANRSLKCDGRLSGSGQRDEFGQRPV